MESLANKKHLLEAECIKDKNLKVLCISEHWYTEKNVDLLNLQNFKLASNFYRKTRERGGVCIFIQEDIECIRRSEIENLSTEYLIELSSIEIPNLNLVIVNVYWPDSNRMPKVFYETLTKLLNLLHKKDRHKNIVIGGDFNTDVSRTSSNSMKLLNQMKTLNLIQLVENPTRTTLTTSKCIDLIFVNFNSKNLNVSVIEYGFSDHSGTLLELISSKIESKKPWLKNIRKFNSKNVLNFITELEQVTWNEILKENNKINTNYILFNNKIQEILNKCIPKVKTKFKSNLKNTWITKGLKISCQNKRLIKQLVKQTDSPVLLDYYKKYEKLLKKSVTISTKLSYKTRIKRSCNISKTMWQIVKERTNKQKPFSKQNIKLKINQNNISENPGLVSNHFNKFFASVGSIDTNIATTPNGRPILKPSQNSFYLKPVDSSEIYNIIHNLKTKKSYGIDEIPPSLIKKCASQLAPPLSFLINQSFTEGEVPDLLKISVLKPIHKKGDHTNCSNYRPIALLPTFSKIFETSMSNRLYSFCEKFNLFSEKQNGFRKNHSTTLAIYKYTNEILKLIDNKQYAIGLLLDMSKAYDRVLYPILLKKLYGMGVRGVPYNWFVSYLTNRTQYTEINHFNFVTREITPVKSEKLDQSQSIPQGSVLGCILFLIYINDLPEIIKTNCTLFADDISLIIPCKDEFDLKEKLDIHLKSTTDWLSDHNLQLNLMKTKLIQFHPHQKKPLNIQYKFQNNFIETTDSYPLLGINIDKNLNWKTHINKLINRLSSFTYALYELKKVTDLKTAMSAYYAYGHSLLRYGIILWGNGTDIKELFTLQKRCIRILVNIDVMESCKPHFINLQILTITSLYILEICTFVKKNINSFDIYTRPSNLRPKTKLARIPTNLKLVDSNTQVMSVKIYNNLPNELRNLIDVKKFSSALKLYLIGKAFYSLQEYFEN